MIHYATFLFSILMMVDLIIYNTIGIVWLGIIFSALPIIYTLIEYVLNNRNSFCVITPTAIIISIIVYYASELDKNSIVTLSIVSVSSVLEFMFYITIYSQMGDCTETFKQNAQLSILLDSSILFIAIGYLLQYFTDATVVIVYASIVLGVLSIGGGVLLYPSISSMIRTRSYELTNNDEQEMELGINDDDI